LRLYCFFKSRDSGEPDTSVARISDPPPTITNLKLSPPLVDVNEPVQSRFTVTVALYGLSVLLAVLRVAEYVAEKVPASSNLPNPSPEKGRTLDPLNWGGWELNPEKVKP